MKRPFTDEDLQAFDLSIARSPYAWDRCRCGHPVSMSGLSPGLVKKKLGGGWYIRHDCWEVRCHRCRDPLGMPANCKSGVILTIPDDPARNLYAGYPQHASTQWRDGAALLPRTDGVYTHTLESKKELFKPRVFRDRCLVFTDDGDVLDLELTHDGYDKDSFKKQAASFVPRLRAGYMSFSPNPDSWRGLYEVTGTTLTCSLTEVRAERYGFTGKLTGDLTTLKLKRVNARGRKLARQEYRFRSLEGAPIWTPPP